LATRLLFRQEHNSVTEESIYYLQKIYIYATEVLIYYL